MTSVAIASINMDGGTQPRAGTVYALQRGHSGGPIKIGFTSDNVFARTRSLQTAAAELLVPIGWAEGTQQDERALHHLLDDFRMSGEWFFPTKKVLAVARDLDGAIASLHGDSDFFPGIPAVVLTPDGFVRTGDMTKAALRTLVASQRAAYEAGRSVSDALARAEATAWHVWRTDPDVSLRDACGAVIRAAA